MVGVLSLSAILAIALLAILASIVQRAIDHARSSAPPVAIAQATHVDTVRNRKVAPVGNPGAWFTANDYPPDARRRGAQGSVTVTLQVGRTGRADGCRVIVSSGVASLDAATCRLAVTRARFRAATDERGRTIPSTFTLPRVRWLMAG